MNYTTYIHLLKSLFLRGRIISEFYSFFQNIYYCLCPYISIGHRTFLGSNISLNVKFGGSIKIGSYCHLQNGVQLITYGGDINIGNRCSINPYTVLYGQGNLTIGNDVRIAAHCVIIPSNHNFKDINKPIVEQGLTNKGIIIQDDVWIGCGVRVLDGVTIAKGCIIGAGSVVTRSTTPYGIYVGIPAKRIKNRND